MNDLIKWIEKNISDGADIQEAKELVEKISVKIENREQAADFIESNRFIKAELDSRISKSVDNAIEKFKETKLPSMLDEEKEKIRKELNPEETPEQKRIRELEDKLSMQEQRALMEDRKAALRAKANELSFDPLRAERYAVYGDEAEKMLSDDIEFFQTQVKEKIDAEIKTRFSGTTPKSGTSAPEGKRSEILAQIDEAKKTGNVQKAFMLNEQLLKIPAET